MFKMEEKNRYSKIKKLVEEIIEPSIKSIKKFRGINVTPHKDIEGLLNIFFPKTKYHESKKGFFKHVYIIHSSKKKLVLKEGSRKAIRKDYTTYKRIPGKVRNRVFAKIYWRSKDGKFMLQKYGKRVKVPKNQLEKLKQVGNEYNLKDIREANVMKFGNKFKIVDAERRK